MKQYYIASICRERIIGGGIVADDEKITFKTGKLTVSQNIQSYSRKWVFCFPVFSITMNDGEIYKFIIFSPGKFNGLLHDKVNREVSC